MKLDSFCACGLTGEVFSLFDLRAGLPITDALGSSNGSAFSSGVCTLPLFGEVGDCCFEGLFCEPTVGKSFIALEKTSGRSNAPGGILFLLGLP